MHLMVFQKNHTTEKKSKQKESYPSKIKVLKFRFNLKIILIIVKVLMLKYYEIKWYIDNSNTLRTKGVNHLG